VGDDRKGAAARDRLFNCLGHVEESIRCAAL
jgi:hypothetical protein